MFRQLVEAQNSSYESFCLDHPQDLLDRIETYWRQGNPLTIYMHNVYANATKETNNEWDHLIYAYLVENTRIYEIFRRVISEYRNGERLGPLSAEAVRWLRNTEELFYTAKYTVGGVAPLASVGAPDWDAARRNAYYRLFGFDLNHGTEDNRPYPFVKPAMANKEVGITLETLLHEVWKGITNARNSSGPKDTDNSEMANLVLRLFHMLRERKSSGKLVREEFWCVATMSWLHMAIEGNSPIVVALQANAESAEERLRRIGQAVGIPAHAKAQAFLLLARNMSVFFREIELGLYNTAGTAQALYQAPVTDMMSDIISQYSIATGKDLKAKQVSVR